MIYQFPFGEVVRPVEQEDRTPKKVFVLGVYASAVHAKWKRGDHVICEALPVASEPRIFWDGNEEEAQEIISRISIPEKAGTLESAGTHYNGPTAKVLEEHILAPLGFTRADAWLCDCLPEARLYPSEAKVIRDYYDPIKFEYDLVDVTIRKRPVVFCDDRRARAIVDELFESQAQTLILLGDIPIGQFLNKVAGVSFRSLEDYTEEFGYGTVTEVTIRGKQINVLPLAHPRQIGVFGAYHEKWHKIHEEWEQKLNG